MSSVCAFDELFEAEKLCIACGSASRKGKNFCRTCMGKRTEIRRLLQFMFDEDLEVSTGWVTRK